MTKKLLIASVAAAVLVPVFAFAQVTTNTGVNVSTTAQTPVGTATVKASGTLSAAVVARAKSRADQELDRRVTALNDVIARIAQMTRVTDQFKTQATTNIQNQINALTQLKAKIDADTDDATLKTDIHSIVTSYRIFILVLPQARIAAAADRGVNIATMESALGAKLKSRIDADAAAGADVTALNTALTDLGTQASSANTSAQAAVSVSINLQPDNGDATVEASNTAALKQARTDIQTAQKALVQGRQDIKTIIDGLKAIHVSSSASSTVQTQ